MRCFLGILVGFYHPQCNEKCSRPAKYALSKSKYSLCKYHECLYLGFLLMCLRMNPVLYLSTLRTFYFCSILAKYGYERCDSSVHISIYFVVFMGPQRSQMSINVCLIESDLVNVYDCRAKNYFAHCVAPRPSSPFSAITLC